ncbi:MAG TPA: queuosine precursor transporter [Candidatus Babeliales bacterium]|nr:queuosine precursor transporter [Candidatus Babeliales bacterium]
MNNEFIFIIHSLIISFSTLYALRIGKDALIALVATLSIIANLFVTKQIALGGFIVTAADAYTIGAVLSLNMLQEYFGSKTAIRAIWISFFMMFVAAIAGQIQLWYLPALCDSMHPHFQALLCNSPRIIAASLIAYLASQHLDRAIFAWLSKQLSGNLMIARFCSSTIIAQLVDTLLFTFLGLYGIVESVWDVVLISYFIKLCAVILTIPAIWLSRFIGQMTNRP